MGGYIVSPNITSIVQEIVNRPDWSAGNYITILAYEKSNTADVWEAVSYDGESANSATLKVKATSSTSPIVCGNSIIETGEVCDSNLKNCTLKSYLGTQSCNSQCNGFNSCQTTQSCGDGVKNGNEICDNGTKNGQPGYCNSLCTGITPIIPPQPVCGNNIIEGNETCDGTNLNGKTCSTLGFTGGTLSCSLCKFNTSKCANPPTQICGNGIKEGNEICDSNLKNCTINSYSGTQACNSLCTGFNSCQTTQSCGDGIKNGNEICDDGNTKNGDGCSSTCKTETPTNQTNISKIILLQMDDCQAWWLRDTCASIVSLHIRKKADINLGFIPYELTQDVAWKIILQNWTNNYPGIIQIGQHSYDHSSQYIGWTVPQIVADMKKGQVEFAKWDIVPKSFVPAYGWSKNVANASNLAGYKVVFNGLDNSYAQGSIGDTMILSDGLYCGDGTKSCVNQDYSLLKSSVDERIVAKGYAIIVFHQQDFGTVGSSQYNTLYNKWSSNIDKFKVDKYTFMTVDEYYNYKKGL